MEKGYIYVVSNPALKEGFLKVGLTKNSPVRRVQSLSRSSSVPADFVLEHSREVSDVVAAEARIHLLLSDSRYNTGKEFFCVDLNAAESIVDHVSSYLEKHEYSSESYGFSDEYVGGHFEGRGCLSLYRYMHLLAALSIGQDLCDHLFGFSDRIVSGFASAEFCAEIFSTKRANAMAQMSKLCRSYKDCWYITASLQRVKVFDYLKYHRGHMAWRYADDFRPLVLNRKSAFL